MEQPVVVRKVMHPILKAGLWLGVTLLCDKEKKTPPLGKIEIKVGSWLCGHADSIEIHQEAKQGAAFTLTNVRLKIPTLPFSGGFVMKQAQRQGMVIDKFYNSWVEEMTQCYNDGEIVVVDQMVCVHESTEEVQE